MNALARFSISWSLRPSGYRPSSCLQDVGDVDDRPALQRVVDHLGESFDGSFTFTVNGDYRQFDWWADFSCIAPHLPEVVRALSSPSGECRLEFFEQGTNVVYEFRSRADNVELRVVDFLGGEILAGPFDIERESTFHAFRAFAAFILEKLKEIVPDDAARTALMDYRSLIESCSFVT